MNKSIYEKIENALSENSKNIMKILESNGFDAYAVGGCVRDAILGVPCHDEDITTVAKPEEVIKLFKSKGFNVIETGIKHGTVTVFSKGSKEGFEITTFRSDGDYSDGRHPDEVIFETDIKKDLERRDLTINAMAYSLSKGFVSAETIDGNGIVHDGLSDLEDNIIRAVGNANERFSEDALRIMRAIRFKAKMNSINGDWSIADDVKLAISSLADNLKLISKERIRDEFLKTLETGDISAIRDFQELGVLKVILPDLDKCANFNQFNQWHNKDLFEHILSSVSYVDKIEEKVVMLLHDIGKIDACKFNTSLDFEKVNELANRFEDVKNVLDNFKNYQSVNNFNNLLEILSRKGMEIPENLKYKTTDINGELFISNSYLEHSKISAEKSINILRELKFSNNQINTIIPLIEHHDLFMSLEDANNKTIKKHLIDFMIENPSLANTEFFDALFRVKEADSNSQNPFANGFAESILFRRKLREISQKILEGPHLLSDLNINGKDLLAVGLKGKEIQETKKDLLRFVMFNPEFNNKEKLSSVIENSIVKYINENPRKILDINESLQENPKIIKAVINKFSEYECSKDFDLEELKKHPDELKNILSTRNFNTEPLIINNDNEYKVQFGQ